MSLTVKLASYWGTLNFYDVMNKYAGTILLDCRIPLAADFFWRLWSMQFVGICRIRHGLHLFRRRGYFALGSNRRNTYLVHWSRNWAIKIKTHWDKNPVLALLSPLIITISYILIGSYARFRHPPEKLQCHRTGILVPYPHLEACPDWKVRCCLCVHITVKYWFIVFPNIFVSWHTCNPKVILDYKGNLGSA